MNHRAWALFSLLIATIPAAQGEEFGRLFFTPQQRLQLDRQESGHHSPDSSQRNYIIVNGVVQKQGGNRTVWINGTPQAAGLSHNKSPTSAPVTVPGKLKPVQLKVGQRLLLDSPAQNNAGETKPGITAPPSAEEDD